MFKWINETSRKVRFSSDLSIILWKSLVYSLINRYNRKVGFTENFLNNEDKNVSVNWQDIAFSFLVVWGVFLFSIKYMGDGLQQAAGDKLRFYIDKYTSNPFFRGFDWYCHDRP